MATKLTKSELKQVIREAFREELLKQKLREKNMKHLKENANTVTAYITYDRYENDEWFDIYYMDTNKQKAIDHCKEYDLFDFISFGPDDCHSFQLQEVEMTREIYKKLNANKGSISSGELYDIMVDIFDGSYNSKTLISTDGETDLINIVHYYGKQQQLDTRDEDVYDELQQELYDDDELFEKVLKSYIKDTY